MIADASVTEKDVTSRVMIWLEVCLGKDAQAFEEVLVSDHL